MKRLFLKIFLAAAVLIPGIAHADDVAHLLVNDEVKDLSFKYLQDIFGVVDGVLHGSGTQIFGQMFGVFNSAVLFLASIIMSYVFFVSTINTAHEGEVLGKKWSSIWIPMRVVAGAALVVPKASGYCTIQIFMMSVIVYGVVWANKVMNAALDYVLNGGVLIQSSPPPAAAKVATAGDLLKSLTCMNGVYNLVLNDAVAKNQTIPPKFVSTYIDVSDASKLQGSQPLIKFPSSEAGNGTTLNLGGICGSVSWSPTNPDSNKLNNDKNATIPDYRGMAVQQMIFDLQLYSQSLADAIVPPNYANTTNSSTTTTTDQAVKGIVDANMYGLIFAAADYKGIMQPFNNVQHDALAQRGRSFIKQVREQGWIMLGSIYFSLAQLNGNINNEDSSKITTVITPTIGSDSSGQDPFKDTKAFLNNVSPGNVFDNYLNCSSGCQSYAVTTTSSGQMNEQPTNYIDLNIYQSKKDPGSSGIYQAGSKTSMSSTGYGAGGLAGQLINLVLSRFIGPIYGLIYNMQALVNAEDQNTDPIIAISGLGSALVGLVTTVWFGVGGGILGFLLGVSVLSCINPGASVGTDFLIWFVPMFTVMLVALFASGAIMAFYVPLIPFILFTFGALGWFAIAIEAMIAAPLVAVGFAYPEGHDVFGKAETAIMLIGNVFLRPSLMVFGFFGGAVLSHVGLWLLNKGYTASFVWAITNNFGNLGPIGMVLAFVAGLVIYLSLVLTIINQTFSLIHALPDELLRWLGGGMRALGITPGEAAGTVKGEFKAGMEALGGGLQNKAQKNLEDKKAGDSADTKGGKLKNTDDKPASGT